MTDKEKIRAEVIKLINEIYGGKSFDSLDKEKQVSLWYLKSIISFIDSMQENPKTKFKVGDRIRIKGRTAKGDIITNIYQAGDGNTYFEFKNSDDAPADCDWELVEEPKKCMFTKDNYTDEDRNVLCEDCEEECEYAKKDLKERYKRIAQSESFKESYDGKSISEEEPSIPEVVDKHWWEMLGEEPVSEDLENASEDYCKSTLVGSHYIKKNAFKAGAQWQKQKDEHLIWQISSANYEKGKQEAKDEMMKDAVSGKVGQTINGMLRVLSDEFFGDLGFKAGDKVKLIIIQED